MENSVTKKTTEKYICPTQWSAVSSSRGGKETKTPSRTLSSPMTNSAFSFSSSGYFPTTVLSFIIILNNLCG